MSFVSDLRRSPVLFCLPYPPHPGTLHSSSGGSHHCWPASSLSASPVLLQVYPDHPLSDLRKTFRPRLLLPSLFTPSTDPAVLYFLFFNCCLCWEWKQLSRVWSMLSTVPLSAPQSYSLQSQPFIPATLLAVLTLLSFSLNGSQKLQHKPAMLVHAFNPRQRQHIAASLRLAWPTYISSSGEEGV